MSPVVKGGPRPTNTLSAAGSGVMRVSDLLPPAAKRPKFAHSPASSVDEFDDPIIQSRPETRTRGASPSSQPTVSEYRRVNSMFVHDGNPRGISRRRSKKLKRPMTHSSLPQTVDLDALDADTRSSTTAESLDGSGGLTNGELRSDPIDLASSVESNRQRAAYRAVSKDPLSSPEAAAPVKRPPLKIWKALQSEGVDELHDGEVLRLPRKTMTPRAQSDSVSRRGDILSARPFTVHQEDAKKMIARGFEVTRAATFRNQYSSEEGGSKSILLASRGTPAVLQAIDMDGDVVPEYGWMKIEPQRLYSIQRARESCIVNISQRGTTMSSTVIEFRDLADTARFRDWVGDIPGTKETIFDRKKMEEMLLSRMKAISNIAQRPVARPVESERQEATATQTRPKEEGPLRKRRELLFAEATKPFSAGMKSSSATFVDGRATPRAVHEASHDSTPTRAMRSRLSLGTGRAVSNEASGDLTETRPTAARSSMESARDLSTDVHHDLRETRVTRSQASFEQARLVKDLSPITLPERWTDQNPDWAVKIGWNGSLFWRRERVDEEDIERLNEASFLNDNLVMFYLRWLLKQTEEARPEVAKRIYLHNSHFYERLKPSKPGSRDINYNAVKSWTTKVDLFKFDYVVVPVCESLHWYVAIICNTPKLIPTAESPPGDSASETSEEETPKEPKNVSVLVSEPLSQLSIEEEVIESIESPERPAAEVVDLDSPEVAALERPAKTREGKKAPGVSRRQDPTLPRIITLDSLDNAHSPTCTHLRDYLAEEMKSRKGVEMPKMQLGMTAKNIPTQSNPFDCGLYLLSYVEKFLEDPDAFIAALHQREPLAMDVDATAMRNRIRSEIFVLKTGSDQKADLRNEKKRR